MTLTDMTEGSSLALETQSRRVVTNPVAEPRDLQRTFQLVLATVWLLDAVLQLQPFMFTRGSSGFSGMLNNLAAGNPGWVGALDHLERLERQSLSGAHQQHLRARAVPHRLRDRVEANPQARTGAVHRLGSGRLVVRGGCSGTSFMAAPPPSAGAPVPCSSTPLLAVLLWPSEGSDRPFVAARTVGVTAARAVWAVVWGLLAVLAVVGSGRSPQALHDLVAAYTGQPGWLARIDRATASMFLHHGTTAGDPARRRLCRRGRRGLPPSSVQSGSRWSSGS